MSRTHPDAEIISSLIVRIQKDVQQLKSMLGISGDQQINIDLIKLNGTSIKNQIIAPSLTKTEHKKYGNDYPRRDIIKFTNVGKGLRRCAILVNDAEVPIVYANLVLLLYFAITLKQEKDFGWVSYDKVGTDDIVQEWKSERIVRNITHFHRVIGELRRQINPYIEPNVNFSIIDIKMGETEYRLTTMPSRIEANPKWLREKYREIRKEVIKNRQKREEQQDEEYWRVRKEWVKEDRQKRKKRRNSSRNTDDADDHMSHPEAYDVLKQAKRDAR